MQKKDIIKYVDKDDCIVVTVDKTIKGNNVVYVARKNLDPEVIAKIILRTMKI